MNPLAPSITPSAVYQLADLDALDAAYVNGDYIYARDGHPNATALAHDINILEAAAWGLAVGSGMAATSVALLLTCPPGAKLLAADQLYGKTFKLFGQLESRGLTVDYINIADINAVRRALPGHAALYVETISNPLMALADLKSLAAIAHDSNAKLIVDNTFATPAVVKPLSLGADIVIESLTKLMNGHSDVTLGYLGGTDATLRAVAADIASTWGFFASPFDCWLVQRGLGMLSLRMREAESNARNVAELLEGLVAKVYYPGIANMLAFELPGRDEVNRFMKHSGIPFCPSLGHHETTISYPWNTSHKAVADDAKRRLGITPGLVRVSVGCEPFAVLAAKLKSGLTTP